MSLIIFFITSFSILTGRIWDPDFFWHLKTGEYMYNNGSLLKSDPFSFTTIEKDPLNPGSQRQKFILTQYWLAQLIFYIIYKYFGFKGIILLRASILTLTIFILYKMLKKERVNFYISLTILFFSLLLFKEFTGERPQLFSFLFTAILIYIIEDYRLFIHPDIEEKSYKWWNNILSLPIIMLIWANMHGGFLLGDVIISLYIFSETMKYIFKKGLYLPEKPFKIFIIMGFISIAFSLINPNVYKVIPVMIELESSVYIKEIIEYFSPIYIYKKFGFIYYGYLYLLIVTIPVILINIKRIDLTDLILISFVTFISLKGSRYMIFFGIVAIPIVGRYIHKNINRILKNVRLKIPNIIGYSLNILISLFLITTIVYGIRQGKIFQYRIRDGFFPEGAVNFIEKNKINGNIFNSFVWGGYLIWKLYPNNKVFMDGRHLVEEIYWEHKKVELASSIPIAGFPEWKSILKAYNIRIILTSSIDKFSGKMFPFIKTLVNDHEFKLVYFDDYSLLYIRNDKENKDIIEKFGMPNEWAYNVVITECAKGIKSIPNNINFYITMGDAFAIKMDFQDAKDIYMKGLKIDPENKIIANRLKMLKSHGY
jgi:hypothetical protein